MKGFVAAPLLALSGCATVPPTHDPEGCDRVSESAKRAGSDLVVDGKIYCATDDGDCELTPRRVIVGKPNSRAMSHVIAVHILRMEAKAHSEELFGRREISPCYPPELWFPSKGHYRGRFYLRKEEGGRYQMAFYPRATKLDEAAE